MSACVGQRNPITRIVNKQQKEQLGEKLVKYHQDMIKQVEFQKMVTCPNYLLEFNAFTLIKLLQIVTDYLQSRTYLVQLKYGDTSMLELYYNCSVKYLVILTRN